MSKKLESILSRVPPAIIKNEEKNNNQLLNIDQTKQERLVAEIPSYLKREIKIYIANNPKETERTVILRGLKSIGFEISDTEFKDKRGYKVTK